MPMTPEQHAEHMQKVQAGLQAIVQTEDINEAHKIAQALLAEEQGEVNQESQNGQPGAAGGEGLRQSLGDAIRKGGI